mmetsp:Transcript_57770/g.161157  ORF Transcript_57770/g.161157 Transcript_57770/m.161157 type:complete len:242 (+) Transcript_57770:1583-2308(+)
MPLTAAQDVPKAVDGARVLSGANVPEKHLSRKACGCALVVAPGVVRHAEDTGGALQCFGGSPLVRVGVQVPNLQGAVPRRADELPRMGRGRGKAEGLHVGGVRGEDIKHVARLYRPHINREVSACGARSNDFSSTVHRHAGELAKPVGTCERPEVSVPEQVKGPHRPVLAGAENGVALRRETQRSDRRSVLRECDEAQAALRVEQLYLAIVTASRKQSAPERAAPIFGRSFCCRERLFPPH